MVAPDVKPWRASMSTRAHSVVELPAGTLRDVDVRIGDPLRVC
jgi:hypothetical protein